MTIEHVMIGAVVLIIVAFVAGLVVGKNNAAKIQAVATQAQTAVKAAETDIKKV